MGSDRVHVLVIGGGITGTATARDLALRGLRVALVEKGDLASGTSSRSSQLVHGGLRYLEHLDFDLVFEALRERQILLRTASHLVHPQRFLFPVFEGDRTGRLRLRAGLFIYDLLAGLRSRPGGRRRHHRISDAADLEPGLTREGLRVLASYEDATTNDARLTLTVARSAAAAGADVATHARATSLLTGPGGGVVGACLRDEIAGSELEVRAHAVVNACGVWAPELLAGSGSPARAVLAPSRGSHLVFERVRLPVRHAVIFESPVDGRIMFVIPWGGFTVVGTTEAAHDGRADEVRATPGEVGYLLESVGKPFAGAALGPGDVCGTWSGLRPLVSTATEGEVPAGAISREHAIFDRPDGLFTITGGKLTTHRRMAEEVGDRVVEYLRRVHAIEPERGCRTHEVPLAGAPPPGRLEDTIADATAAGRRLDLPDATGAHLVRRFGLGWEDVLRRIEHEPGLAEPLAPPLPYTAAEAVHAADHEMTCSLTDFMVRRTHLIYATRGDHEAIADRAAAALGRALGWDEDERASQIARYRAERERRREPAAPGRQELRGLENPADRSL